MGKGRVIHSRATDPRTGGGGGTAGGGVSCTLLPRWHDCAQDGADNVPLCQGCRGLRRRAVVFANPRENREKILRGIELMATRKQRILCSLLVGTMTVVGNRLQSEHADRCYVVRHYA